MYIDYKLGIEPFTFTMINQVFTKGLQQVQFCQVVYFTSLSEYEIGNTLVVG
jgi:hypothetical protein